MKELSPEQKALIAKPLPSEAISQHPTKTYLSSIKAIYVTERMNEVFGIGGWTMKVKHQETLEWGMVVVHVTYEATEYWIYYECFGGNDNWGENSKNFDLWDAYKWATTDALTKIGSWIGIGADVFKGKKWNTTNTTTTQSVHTWAKTTQWFNKPQLEQCIAEDNAFSKASIEEWAKDNWYTLSWPSRAMIDKYLNQWEL